MTNNGTAVRLIRLEEHFRPPVGCPTCRDWTAVRLVAVDDDDNELWASFPAHCPDCGRRTGPEMTDPWAVCAMRDHAPAEDPGAIREIRVVADLADL